MDTLQEIEYKGHVIKIEPDDCSGQDSPREWDNLGVMCYRHRDYKLGDLAIPEYYIDKNGESIDIDGPETFRKWYESDTGEHIEIMLPLSLYDHSGITMWVGTTSGWDNSNVGWIVATREALLKNYKVKRLTKAIKARAEDVLRGEVKTFDTYIRGDVVGYVVDGPDCDDSCWGFYDIEDAIAQAKDTIDYAVSQEKLYTVTIKELHRYKNIKAKTRAEAINKIIALEWTGKAETIESSAKVE